MQITFSPRYSGYFKRALRSKRGLILQLNVLAVALSASPCFAQSADGKAEAEASVGTSGASASANTDANNNGSPATNRDAAGNTPSTSPLTTNGAAPGNTDHSQVVGHLAVGYLGLQSVSMINIANAAPEFTAVNAPVVGVRYWLFPRLGIDAGIGIGVSGQSATVGGTETKAPNPFALVIHGGVPLVLAETDHFAFELIPEFNFGFASNTVPSATGDFDYSAVHFDLGARVGAEIQFGFMGLPRLSLQAGVGVLFGTDSSSVEQPGAAPKIELSRYGFGTTLNGDPWNIFAGSIRALYYL